LREPAGDSRVIVVAERAEVGRVRRAHVEDARAIAEIHVRSWRAAYAGQLPDQLLQGRSIADLEAGWRRRLTKPRNGSRVLLVEQEPGHPVGFASVGPSRDPDADGHTGELEAFYLDPDHWRQGLGRRLHDHALTELRRDGYGVATLWVLRSHHAAQRFYAKAGWVPDGAAKTDVIGDVPLDEIRYATPLTGPGPGRVHGMEWQTVREGNVPIETHTALAGLLRAAYPQFPEYFGGRRSWSYVRPELRVIGWAGGSAVATAGVLRRFIEVGGSDQLVAIVGLVAVHPDHQGTGTGLALMEHTAAALTSLDVPFGILMCADRLVGFYQRAGWHLLSPRPVTYSPDDTTEPRPFVDEIATAAMVLPVSAALADWPDGPMNWHGASV
jgi:nodulation protein A